MQLMVTSVDDNIKYLKNCGAKHHIEMSTEIMYYTQGLQFRRTEDDYLQRCYFVITNLGMRSMTIHQK